MMTSHCGFAIVTKQFLRCALNFLNVVLIHLSLMEGMQVYVLK